MNNLNANITSNGTMHNMNGNINAMNLNAMNPMNVNNQMAQIQQQMQQWQLNNATNAQQGIHPHPHSYYDPSVYYKQSPPTHSLELSTKGNGTVNVGQFTFPAAAPVMMQAPTLFNMNNQQQQQNGVNNVAQQQATNV